MHYFQNGIIEIKIPNLRGDNCLHGNDNARHTGSIYHFSQEDSFLKEREGSQPSE